MQVGDGIMDMFVAWFEKEQVGARIDQFIKDNAKRIGVLEFGGARTASTTDWWPLYCGIRHSLRRCSRLSGQAGCTAGEFFMRRSGPSMSELPLACSSPIQV